MEYQYVISKDDETNEIELIGRFSNHNLAEIWWDGKWHQSNSLYGELLDGLLDEISEAEAMKVISQRQPQLEAA